MVVINFFCQVGLFASGFVRSHDSASGKLSAAYSFQRRRQVVMMKL